MWEREGGRRTTTTTMVRGGKGYRAIVAVVTVCSVVAVCRHNDIDCFWRGAGEWGGTSSSSTPQSCESDDVCERERWGEGRGYRAIVAIVTICSAVVVFRCNDVDGFWRGAGGGRRDIVIITAIKLR